MRKIIFESSVSADGFIEGPNGELDWRLIGHHAWTVPRLLSLFDTIFYGRKTYEVLNLTTAYDRINGQVDRPAHDALYGMRKYVFSRTKKHVGGNAMVVGDDLETEVRRIRAEEGKNIWLCGGADILKTFASLDLVDEYVLCVHPVLLMAGKPLFPERQIPNDLKLLEKYKMPSGAVILRYGPESRINFHL